MREIKAVSFNVKDAYEMKLFKHSNGQGSFSKYVKRLIGFHMEGIQNKNPDLSSFPASEIKTDIDTFGY